MTSLRVGVKVGERVEAREDEREAVLGTGSRVVIVVGCRGWVDWRGGSCGPGGAVALVVVNVEDKNDWVSSDAIGDGNVRDVVGTKDDGTSVLVLKGGKGSTVRVISVLVVVPVGDGLSPPPSPSPMVTVMVLLGSSVTMFVLVA